MNLRSLGASSAVALLSVATLATGAQAEGSAEEYFGGAASGRAVDLIAGNQRLAFGAGMASGEVDAVAGDVVASAAGIGSVLAEGTMVAAGSVGEQHDGCAVPELGELFSLLHVEAGVVCGRASVTGSGTDLDARGSGSLATLTLEADSVVAGLIDTLRNHEKLGPVLDIAFGQLQSVVDGDAAVDTVDQKVDPTLHQAATLLDGTLSGATGGQVTLPDLDASDTLRDLLDRLARVDLATVTFGEASGRVSSDDDRLVSAASDEGAVIDVLPGFWPDGGELVRITVAPSSAEVVYDRSTTVAEASANTGQVVIESRLLDEPVVVGEGQAVQVLCSDGKTGADVGVLTGDALCIEVAVGTPEHGEVDGRPQVRAATTTVRIARGVQDLAVPTQNLPVVGEVGPHTLVETVNNVFRLLDIDEGVATAAGTPSPAGGVELTLGGATAQGGGAQVLPKQEYTDPGRHLGEGTLPRTGGFAGLPAAAALLGAGAGLQMIVRRRFGA